MTSVEVVLPGPSMGWDERISWLCGQLRSFASDLSRLQRHADQFELQLAYMYQRFVRSGPAFIGPRITGPDPGGADNLDSGNAALPPPATLVRGLRSGLEETVDLRVYSGPEADPALAAAAAGYWNHLLRPARPVTPAEVTVGAGTVNLWDCVVRQYLRPGDGVVVATPTYGFFLPHVTRAGGVLIGLPVRGREYSAAQLSRAVREHDGAALESWRRGGGVQRLRNAFATRVGEAMADALAERGDAEFAAARGPGELARALLAAVPVADPAGLAALLTDFGPPRAALLLHLNPTLSGGVHDKERTRALAAAADAAELRIIEDLSYFPVRCAEHTVVSVREFSPRAVSLLGVSKVLGVADLRIGLAVCHPDDGAALMRRVENSVGFVPRFVQRAVAAQLTDLPGTDLFLARSDAAYRTRLDLLMCCLAAPDRGAIDRAGAAAVLRDLTPLIEGDRAEVEELSARFLAGGLAAYLRLDSVPEAGFFALLDCSGALAALRGAGLAEVRDAFALAGLLAHLVGVRTIAAEVADTDVMSAPALLRVSFSVTERTLVTTLFYVFALLDGLVR